MLGNRSENGVVLLVGSPWRLARVSALAEAQRISCRRAGGPVEVLRTLRTNPSIDVLVLAPDAAVNEYVELCRTVKFDLRTRLVGVICLVPVEATGRRVDLYAAGADDCIAADASEEEMGIRLMRALRAQRMNRSLDDASAVITSLATAIEGKDHYTCGHVERVGSYSVEIGKRIGLDSADLEALKMGGIVHDIGKVMIPEPILNKPGKLTEEEMRIMRRHPVIGFEILQPLRSFREVLPIVRWHHEKPNGTGYPDGLKGDDLPLLPRIAAVADVFDALSTDRPYRPAFALDKCILMLKEDAQQGNLDEMLVEVMLQILHAGLPASVVASAA